MDPVSVIALTGSVTGILDVLTRSLGSLYNLAQKYIHTAISVQVIATQLSTLRSALDQLLQWMKFAPISLRDNRTLCADLYNSISACSLIIQTLDSDVKKALNSSTGSIRASRKILLMFDTTMKEREVQLSHLSTALTLLLQAINSRSSAEQEQSLQSEPHRQAMSDIEDDSMSIRGRYSLLSRELSVSSRITSKLSNLTDVFDLYWEMPALEPLPETGSTDTLIESPPERRVRFTTPEKDIEQELPPKSRDSNSSEQQTSDRKFKRLLSRSTCPLLPLQSLMLNRSPPTSPTQQTQKDQPVQRVGKPSTLKVALFGIGGSGKTSLFKSFQLLCTGQLDELPRKWLGCLMLECCVERMLDVIGIMETANIKFASPQSTSHFKAFESMLWPERDPTRLREEMGLLAPSFNSWVSSGGRQPPEPSFVDQVCSAVTYLWQDAGVKEAFNRLSRSYVSRDATFLFENVWRYAKGYEANNDDRFKLYTRTTGIYERVFNYLNMTLCINDHGGTRNERKKWMYSKGPTDAIVFTVDITCWKRVLFEDHTADAMNESLTLFHNIANSTQFGTPSIILVFTNAKALKSKLVTEPFENYDEDYTMGQNPSLVKEHLQNLFLKGVHKDHVSRVAVVYTDIVNGLTRPAEQVLSEIQRRCGAGLTATTGNTAAITTAASYPSIMMTPAIKAC